jgi:hypothetical protein
MTQRPLPLGELHHEHLTREQVAIRIRLGRLLFWHTRPEDAALSDNDFIEAVYRRRRATMGYPLLDPNE